MRRDTVTGESHHSFLPFVGSLIILLHLQEPEDQVSDSPACCSLLLSRERVLPPFQDVRLAFGYRFG